MTLTVPLPEVPLAVAAPPPPAPPELLCRRTAVPAGSTSRGSCRIARRRRSRSRSRSAPPAHASVQTGEIMIRRYHQKRLLKALAAPVAIEVVAVDVASPPLNSDPPVPPVAVAVAEPLPEPVTLDTALAAPPSPRPEKIGPIGSKTSWPPLPPFALAVAFAVPTLEALPRQRLRLRYHLTLRVAIPASCIGIKIIG